MIELSSDTRTKPTQAMRQAIANAVVGDEQAGEDPTINALNERVAALLGKEASVFLPSGTMCNQIAMALHCRPGDELIAHRDAHVIVWEAGGAGHLAGAQTFGIDQPDGILTVEQVAAAIRPINRGMPRSKLLVIEQTSNSGGGRVWPLERVQAVATLAHAHGLAVHMDGARLMNAVVKSGVSPAQFAAPCDSVWIDYSKGLGAPIGASLAGSKEFVQDAWRLKQRFGGAMRQAGIIAAAALYALDHHVDRLAEDHANAQVLATGLAEVPGIAIDPTTVETNLVFFTVTKQGWTAERLATQCRSNGVAFGYFGPARCRMVTHHDVTTADCRRAAEVVREVLAG